MASHSKVTQKFDTRSNNCRCSSLALRGSPRPGPPVAPHCQRARVFPRGLLQAHGRRRGPLLAECVVDDAVAVTRPNRSTFSDQFAKGCNCKSLGVDCDDR